MSKKLTILGPDERFHSTVEPRDHGVDVKRYTGSLQLVALLIRDKPFHVVLDEETDRLWRSR